ANLHAVRFAAHVAKAELARRKIPATVFDHAVFGTTTPQRSSFYGLPWLMSMIGNSNVGGTVVSQACATSARVLATAAGDIEQGFGTTSLCISGDRTSNAPVVTYPNPTAQGGAPLVEHWMLDNFNTDPLGGPAMVGTAENCARDWQIGTEEQHDVVLRRWQQYEAALANERAFQKRYMTLPFHVPDPSFNKTPPPI